MFQKKIELEVDLKDKGKRLDVFLCENIENLTRSYIQNLIDNQNISIKNFDKIKAGQKLKGNEIINIIIPEDEVLEVEAENIPINIIYEDSHMLVINKEANMVVHPAPGNYNGTLVNAIMYHIKDLSSINGIIRPGIVHRLDKDTSGLIMIAKSDSSHIKLADMLKEKTIEKYYLAIVKGNIKLDSGRIENKIGRKQKDRKKMTVTDKNSKLAISNYYVIDRSSTHTLVLVGIETGRTHQIRVHMKHIGHPIEGDQVYSNNNKYAKRQMLHAYKLNFLHPISGMEMNLTGKLPEDFNKTLKTLGLNVNEGRIEDVLNNRF